MSLLERASAFLGFAEGFFPHNRLYHRMLGVPAPSLSAPIRLLVVANALIPTVQLSLVYPLRDLLISRKVSIEFLTEEHLKKKFGKKLRGPEARQWFLRRLVESKTTCLFICRYSGPFSKDLLSYASTKQVRTIYCIDDDLLNVPREIGQAKFDYHNHPLRLEAVRFLLEECEFVYCSNDRLARRLKELGIRRDFYVGRIFCAGSVLKAPREGQTLTLGYMGFDHAHDFKVALPALVRLLRRHPHIRFELFGRIARPPELAEFGSRVLELPVNANYRVFLDVLASRDWDVGICPLASTPFNVVKNVNKWIEYSSVGAAAVATAGTIYDEPCSEGCGWLVDDNEWDDALESLVCNSEIRLQLARAAQEKLQHEYTLDALRQQVLELVAQPSLRAGL